MRICCGRHYPDGAPHQRQTRVHRISIHHAVAFGGQWSGLQRVDNESVKQADITCGIIRLAHLPEGEQMATVGTSRRFIDNRFARRARPSFDIDIGRRGKPGRRNPRGPRRRHLDRDGSSGMVADDSGLRKSQGVKQIESTGGPGLD